MTAPLSKPQMNTSDIDLIDQLGPFWARIEQDRIRINLIRRLHEEANKQMPTWAEESSAHWYVHGGGRTQRALAHLLREAAEAIELL